MHCCIMRREDDCIKRNMSRTATTSSAPHTWLSAPWYLRIYRHAFVLCTAIVCIAAFTSVCDHRGTARSWTMQQASVASNMPAPCKTCVSGAPVLDAHARVQRPTRYRALRRLDGKAAGPGGALPTPGRLACWFNLQMLKYSNIQISRLGCTVSRQVLTVGRINS